MLWQLSTTLWLPVKTLTFVSLKFLKYVNLTASHLECPCSWECISKRCNVSFSLVTYKHCNKRDMLQFYVPTVTSNKDDFNNLICIYMYVFHM